MHVVLYGLGLLTLAIGFALVGYGIPINEFSLGNTLIIAGSVTATGGLLLLGFAATVRHLRQIADALSARGMPRPARAAEPPEPQLPGSPARSGAGRIPFPPRPPMPPTEPPPRDPRGYEPRLGASPPLDAAQNDVEPAGGADSEVRPPVVPLLRPAEPPLVEHDDNVTLSPHAPRGAPEPATRPRPAAPALGEVKAVPGHSPLNGGAPAPVGEPRVDMPWRPAAERVAEVQKPAANFDTVWPERRPPVAAPVAPPNPVGPRQPMSAAALLRPAEAKAAESRVEPRPAPARRESADAEPAVAPRPASAQPASQAEARAVAILKSGVVDGMAYTLYADGSIEAQLPQGTVRFGSIAELREHIEKNS